MEEDVTPKAIENPTQLLDWIEARGQKNIVFSVGDAKRMASDFQHILLWIYAKCHGGVHEMILMADRSIEARLPSLLNKCSREGYILLPVAALRALDMPALAALQDLAYAYKEVRESQWFPVEEKPCGCNGGCETCHGTGEIEVLVEMSAHERALAERGYEVSDR